MATFGGLGGLGGRPVSYPARFGSPFSTLIDYVPDREQWEADWQRRYDAEAAKRRAPSGYDLVPGNAGFSPTANAAHLNTIRGQQEASFSDHIRPEDTGALSRLLDRATELGMDLRLGADGNPTVGKSAYLQHGSGSHKIPGATGFSAGYTPDFSALNAERERMMPLFENRAIQQSAYNSMRGWGQENGVIGPDYSRPGAHQVGPNEGNPYAPNHVPGVGMDWTEAAGLPDAQTNRTGVYSPGVTRRNNGWGLW